MLVGVTPSPVAAQSGVAATAMPLPSVVEPAGATVGGQSARSVSPAIIESPSNTAVGRDALVLITTGFYNVAVGNAALHDTTIGTQNTATGAFSMFWNTTGEFNTAIGTQALFNNISGGYNTAAGRFALLANDTGSFNTAIGHEAANSNVSGISNTAAGRAALYSNTTGHSNTAIGDNAGAFATSGSYNVYVGADVFGVADEANTMRLGLPYDGSTGQGQSQTFVAGIHGTALTGPAVPVYVDANGQLGTIVPPVQTGSVSEPVSSPAAALASRLGAAEERNRKQQAEIADLRARLAQLERLVAGRPGRY
jgi:hypothetical protein